METFEIYTNYIIQPMLSKISSAKIRRFFQFSQISVISFNSSFSMDTLLYEKVRVQQYLYLYTTCNNSFHGCLFISWWFLSTSQFCESKKYYGVKK